MLQKKIYGIICFYLVKDKNIATSTLNIAINALKFYYGTILKRKFVYDIKRPRKDKKLPVVLSQEEISKILSSVGNVKHKAILMLIYSSGLRLSEVVKLRVEDIDSQRMLVHIKEAKGRKDRYTILQKWLSKPSRSTGSSTNPQNGFLQELNQIDT
jgi:site-specific recombinase XerD